MLESIDSLLQILKAQQGNELSLQTGHPAQFLLPSGPVDLSSDALSQQEIAAALGPIIPDAARRLLPTQALVEFNYSSYPSGLFHVVITRSGNQLAARFTPTDESGTPAYAAPAAPSYSAPAPPPISYAPHVQPPSAPAPQTSEPATASRPTRRPRPTGPIAIDRLFMGMCEAKASDLHLSVGSPPLIRKDGRMVPLDPSQPAFTAESMRETLDELLPDKNYYEIEDNWDTDFAYEIEGLARFRCNVFLDRKGMGAVFRVIPSKILTAEQLGLSPYILKLCQLTKGLVLVTGPTGSGKSTTLCALIDYINSMRDDHIITIEDPIEFVHENKRCLINQREVHMHTDSFKDALRAALREDPDIILVGEMRDLETISIAIETAETGHLVFGTLHTTTAASTVDRIIDQFPTDRQAQIRVMLSESLRGVIAQTLCRKVGGGRIAALEVLIVNSAISNLIREGKTFQIPSMMQTGRGIGMVSLNDALLELVTSGKVEPQEAYAKSVDKTGFEALLKRANIDTSFMSGSGAHA